MNLRDMAEARVSTGGVSTVADAANEPAAAIRSNLTPAAAVDLTALPEVPNDAPFVHEAWSRVMADVQFIAKARQTENGARYKYRGIDDVINTVGPVLRRHGVAVIPIGASPEFTIINTTKGAAMNYCRVVARFQVFGPRGDSFIGETLGEGFDNGDKSASKASSVALRTFYIQALAIPTDAPELDTEYGTQHEIATAPRPTAAQYAAMIHDPETSVARLQQIKQELDNDPPMAHTQVTDLEDAPIELGRLVRRIGAARLAKEKGE
jgi:hypothetical protein